MERQSQEKIVKIVHKTCLSAKIPVEMGKLIQEKLVRLVPRMSLYVKRLAEMEK
jgi:hypothetical protein